MATIAAQKSREHTLDAKHNNSFSKPLWKLCVHSTNILNGHIFIHWIIWKRFLASQECENVKCGKQQIPIQKFRAIASSRFLWHVLWNGCYCCCCCCRPPPPFFLFTPVQRLECEQNAEIIKPIHKTCLIVISANWKRREKLQTVVLWRATILMQTFANVTSTHIRTHVLCICVV